jgi:hypothetical protein
MKKKEKIRLKDYKRKVEEIKNNSRYIELTEKLTQWLEGKIEMSEEELEEWRSLQKEYLSALNACTRALNRANLKVQKINLCVILPIQIFALVLALIALITKLL